VPAAAGRTTPPGDTTPRMLGECACAVNWDAPGRRHGARHRSPSGGAPTGDAAANRVEPGPRRGFSIRASAPLVKGCACEGPPTAPVALGGP